MLPVREESPLNDVIAYYSTLNQLYNPSALTMCFAVLLLCYEGQKRLTDD